VIVASLSLVLGTRAIRQGDDANTGWVVVIAGAATLALTLISLTLTHRWIDDTVTNLFTPRAEVAAGAAAGSASSAERTSWLERRQRAADAFVRSGERVNLTDEHGNVVPFEPNSSDLSMRANWMAIAATQNDRRTSMLICSGIALASLGLGLLSRPMPRWRMDLASIRDWYLQRTFYGAADGSRWMRTSRYAYRLRSAEQEVELWGATRRQVLRGFQLIALIELLRAAARAALAVQLYFGWSRYAWYLPTLAVSVPLLLMGLLLMRDLAASKRALVALPAVYAEPSPLPGLHWAAAHLSETFLRSSIVLLVCSWLGLCVVVDGDTSMILIVSIVALWGYAWCANAIQAKRAGQPVTTLGATEML